MKRREFLAGSAVAAVAVSLPVFAKEPSLIAVLGSGSEKAPYSVNLMSWLRNGLRGVGLVEGQEFILEARWANGEYHRFPALAAEPSLSRSDPVPSWSRPLPRRKLHATFPRLFPL
jgi:putative tryptophan/tyrosine transport system substrate-binding protein